MKKIMLLLSAVVLLAATESCDTKACKCYVRSGDGGVQEIDYVDEGTSCSTLDRYTSGNKPVRICTEYNERDLDPDDIGWEIKK